MILNGKQKHTIITLICFKIENAGLIDMLHTVNLGIVDFIMITYTVRI